MVISRRINLVYVAFGLLLALQASYWWQARPYKPDLTIVPNVPRLEAVKAISMGSEELYFRLLALTLQNFGDTFGRVTALKDYDFSKLSRWFALLDGLNTKSDMIPALASYYFGQSQRTEDVRYIVDYLYAHSMRDVKKKWWWLVQCIYLASHKLKDEPLTLKVARPLLDPDVPAWAQQMLAVVYEKRGEMEDALKIMEVISKNAKEITDKDLKFMRVFVEERIKKLDEWNKHGNIPLE